MDITLFSRYVFLAVFYSHNPRNSIGFAGEDCAEVIDFDDYT
jgi:hypothetical protein